MQVTTKFYEAVGAVVNAHQEVLDSLIPLDHCTVDEYDTWAMNRIRLINKKAKLTEALTELTRQVAERP